ncbi:hypothetical protein BDV06DRAFT_143657 [Aspergillus oleicola]
MQGYCEWLPAVTIIPPASLLLVVLLLYKRRWSVSPRHYVHIILIYSASHTASPEATGLIWADRQSRVWGKRQKTKRN